MATKEAWTLQLDWLNIVRILELESITEIPEYKKEKALKKLSKQYGTDLLNSFAPDELDELVANELREGMKKELIILQKAKEKQERDLQNKLAPFKKSGIIGIDMDPDDFMKFFKNAMRRGDDDDDKDDDLDRSDDDRNGYYI
ncbi:MAG: hypothetical protein ACFFKA_20985 [Candidatus Thorarchaeota archaeon]